MRRNNAWLAQLGILFFTFAIGIGMGFSIRDAMEPVKPAVAETASNIPDAPLAAESSPEPREPAASPPPDSSAAPAEPESTAASSPATPAPGPDSAWPGRHLFIAVDGAWLSDETKALLREIRPGGVLFRAGNLQSPNQTLALAREIKDTVGLGQQRFSALPLIAVDHEGGDRNALALAEAPSAAQIGAAQDAAAAKRIGAAYASESADRGISVLFAPVLDVYDAAGVTPGLQSRSFGPEESLVTSIGLAMADGIMDGGVIPVAKYFPGLGPAVHGPDGKSLVLNIDNRRLAEIMFPFSEAVTHKVPGILIGHVAVPKFNTGDPQRSAALSRTLVHSLFRDLWKYEGVLVADDVAFNPMTESRPAERAAVEALMAGCDAVVFLDPDPARIRAVCAAIESAATSGELGKEQLTASKGRLDAWQSWLDRPRPLGDSLPTPRTVVAQAPTQDAPPAATAPDPVATQEAPSVPPAETTHEVVASAPQDNAGSLPSATPIPENIPPAIPSSSVTTDSPENPPSTAPPENAPAVTEESVPTVPSPEASADSAPASPDSGVAPPAAAEATTGTETTDGNAESVPLATEAPAENVPAAEPPTDPVTDPVVATIENPAPSVDSASGDTSPVVASPPDASTASETNLSIPDAEANAATADTDGATDAATSDLAEQPIVSASSESKNVSLDPEAGQPVGTAPISPEPTIPADAVPPPSAPVGTELSHTVQRQETLIAIAKQYDVEVQDLVAWNKLSDVRIDAGQVLKVIPGGKAEPPATGTGTDPATTTYRVRRGDTLTKIATRHGISLNVLLEMNGLNDPNEITVGQKLKVPL